MTTDVINGEPRSLLEQVAIELEHDNDRYMLGRELRKLLATAQPADHSEHALKMVAQPAADGEREAFEAWIKQEAGDHAAKRWPTDTGPGYANDRVQDYRAGWVECLNWRARAAQPQQAVAVTDEVRRDAERYRFLRKPNGAVFCRAFEYFPGADDPTGAHLVALETLDEAIDAALSAHKTGEEE